MQHTSGGTTSSPEASTGFESLPCEIILEILPRITDLASLYNILRASPAALAVFNRNNPADITESVLSSGYTCQQIQSMVRFGAVQRSLKLPPWHDEEFMKFIFQEPMQAERRVSTYEPERLAHDTKLSVIHELLRTARDITNVSLHCLSDSLRLFRSLRPRRPVNTDFRFIAWTHPPETEELEVMDIGPPTWTEEQRVMRAFWRLQVAYDALCASFTRELPPNYGVRESHCHLYGPAVHRSVRHSQPSSIEEDCYDVQRPALYSAGMHRTHQTRSKTPSPEYYEIVSVVDYIGERFGQELADELASNHTYVESILLQYLAPFSEEDEYRDVAPELEDTVRQWPMPMPACNDEMALLRPSPAVKRIFDMSLVGRDGGKGPPSSVASVFDPFNRYGLAFWCEERLQGYGLATSKADHASPLQDQVNGTWLSLLTPDELAFVRESLMKNESTG
ncbi:hypothetical protein E4U41_005523 [Claviceps citrina]|nr:hypothetical protein E4U41_005523 [Claviceps citrina]